MIRYRGKVIYRRNNKDFQGVVPQISDSDNEEDRGARENIPSDTETTDPVDETAEQTPIPATELPGPGSVEPNSRRPGDFAPELCDSWLDWLEEEDFFSL